MHKLKSLQSVFNRLDYNDNNFHRIAISNLNTPSRQIERWWEDKFQKPSKAFEDYTEEELYIMMLEDYYEKNPKEADRFMGHSDEDWDGEIDSEHERAMQDRIEDIQKPYDLSRWQSNDDYDEVDLVKDLEKSFPSLDKDEGEFEETFIGD